MLTQERILIKLFYPFYCFLPMKLFFFIIAAGIVFPFSSTAQEINYSGAGSLSTGGISSVERNIFSVFSNPAGITGVKHPSVGISYICPYNITKLSNRSVSAVAPTRLGHFSAYYAQSGYSLSLMNLFGASYARTFGSVVSASLSFNGIRHRLDYSGSYGGFFATAGIQIFPSGKVTLGFFIKNFSRSKISYPDRKEDIPVLFAGGISWYPAEQVGLSAEIEKDDRFDPVYKFGMFYKPVHFLVLRGGVKGTPVEISFGAGYVSGFFSIDIGMAYHQQLGITSGASLRLSLVKQHSAVSKE